MKFRNIVNKSYIYFLSFIIPFLVLVTAYMINGIFPGSEKSVLISDMGGQYIGFFLFPRYMGIGYNNIMFQTMCSLGGGYFGTWAYYTSDPLNTFLLLFDPLLLPDAIYFLTLLKISLCGLTFSLFLKYGHIKSKNPLIIVISSVSYSLMSFNVVYSLDIMWISGAIMLPLVILGIDRILDSKRRELFIISLAYSVIANYYIAYMIVLFCVIYYFYRSICDSLPMKKFLRYSLELFSCGILSAFISTWLWLPVLIDLLKGKFSENPNIHYGLIRQPLEFLRQLLPLSFDGVSFKDSPPMYCGLIITCFAFIYFFLKNVSVRKKIGALFVYIIFFLSFSLGLFDIVWHCFRLPNGFPGRYVFVFSFFMVFLFAESADDIRLPFKRSVSRFLRILICVFVVTDLVINSAYSIHSLDIDRGTGGYGNNSDYFNFYKRNEIYKALGYTYPSRIASYYDYSHVDGFVFAVPSLDYYSSSYNYNLSMFFRDLGMNSIFQYSEDSGITPVTASVFNVDAAVNYGGHNEYSLLFELYDPVYAGDDFVLYRNPYPGSLGYVYTEDTYSSDDDVFKNLNHLYHDFTGEDVFIECGREDVPVDPIDGEALYARDITLYPEAGKHLFIYVSPNDYYDNDKTGCKDILYFNGNPVAYYSDTPDRYIFDLGYADGSVLHFTFETDNIDNEVFFYTFDDELFVNSVTALADKGLHNVDYSDKGIDASITVEEDCDVAVFLPYETGYDITIDGESVDYSSYAGCILSIPVRTGNHDIHISFRTPGLKAAIIISFVGFVMLIIFIIFDERKRRKAQK